MKTILVSAFFLLVIGAVGHADKQDQLMQQASNVCQNQMYATMPTFDRCIQNQLEQNGDK